MAPPPQHEQQTTTRGRRGRGWWRCCAGVGVPLLAVVAWVLVATPTARLVGCFVSDACEQMRAADAMATLIVWMWGAPEKLLGVDPASSGSKTRTAVATFAAEANSALRIFTDLAVSSSTRHALHEAPLAIPCPITIPGSGDNADLKAVQTHVLVRRSVANKPNKPVVVYLHPGGALVGFPVDAFALHFAAELESSLIVAVDYAKFPRRFPVALEQTMCVLAHVAKHADKLGADPDRIVLLGVDWGALLAAAAAGAARDRGGPRVRLQALVVPVLSPPTTGAHAAAERTRDSETALQTWLWRAHVGSPNLTSCSLNPECNPLARPGSSFKDLAPAVLFAASGDTPHAQRDASALHALLRSHGVDATLHTFHGSHLAFVVRSHISEVVRAVRRVVHGVDEPLYRIS